MAADKYAKQREAVTPPHVPLKAVRIRLGLTQQDVVDRMEAEGVEFSKGALSAIESGLRGASTETLAAVAVALGFADDTLTVSYEPRDRREREQVPA